MGTYNLATKYETKLDKRFCDGSFTDRFTSKEYSFDGVNSIKLWTLDKATINDYTLSPNAGVSRFGALEEVGDEVATYTLVKKRSFNTSFDITNVQDQMFVKKANAYLKQVWDEQFVPEIDKYRFDAWANGAGQVLINGTALTKATIIEAMLTANAALNNKHVPRKGRVFFISETLAIKFKLAEELKNNESFTTKAIINGQIGNLAGHPVVAVPDDMLPSGMNFMLKYNKATVDPMKLKMLRVITNSEMVAGSIMQGLVRYDAFVLANKANGIYCHFQSGAQANVTFDGTTTSGKLAMTSASGTIKYTTDGSNPKTSATAQAYSAAINTPATGTVVRAYASASGKINSGITEYVVG